jgi:hypothetical protein
VRWALLLGALAALALGVSAGPAAAATNECRGLPVCVPVAGPWVVLPTKLSPPRPQVQFSLSCPKGYLVAGFDAELSERAIDVAFLGTMGAPVNPGISTSPDAVFVGTYVGGTARLPSFRPHIGCMPARGGGGSRTPTAAVFPPGKPLVRHVRNVLLQPGRRTVLQSCAAGERLIDATHAVAFDRIAPPDGRLGGAVTVAQTLLRTQATRATVRTGRAAAGARPLVQVVAVCAGGR